MLSNRSHLMERLGACLAFLLAATPLHAELVFSTPPWSSEESNKAMFEPIAEAMSKWLRTPVVYQSNSDFASYAQNMRSGKYDIVLDGPQFNAWRMKHLQHEPLVTLPEKLEFYAVTINKALKSTEDLIGKPVCGQAPPQLGTLLLWAQFRLDREPVLNAIKGEAQVLNDLKAGKCETAILRNNAYHKMSESEKARFKVIYMSRAVPNDTFSVGAKITKAQRQLLISKMTDPANGAVFKRFFDFKAQAANQFVEAESAQYSGLEILMDSVAYW